MVPTGSSQMMRFTCKYCGETLNVPLSQANVSGPCPRCSRVIQAPDVSEATPPQPVTIQPRSIKRREGELTPGTASIPPAPQPQMPHDPYGVVHGGIPQAPMPPQHQGAYPPVGYPGYPPMPPGYPQQAYPAYPPQAPGYPPHAYPPQPYHDPYQAPPAPPQWGADPSHYAAPHTPAPPVKVALKKPHRHSAPDSPAGSPFDQPDSEGGGEESGSRRSKIISGDTGLSLEHEDKKESVVILKMFYLAVTVCIICAVVYYLTTEQL